MNDCGDVVGVVLAGGEGRRLRPLTYYFQKCKIPIGSRQKPLLECIIRLLGRYGTFDKRFGVRLEYIHDDPALGGSGGALLNAAEKGAFDGAGSLLGYYGDIISDIDLYVMLRQHRKSKSVATLARVRW